MRLINQECILWDVFIVKGVYGMRKILLAFLLLFPTNLFAQNNSITAILPCDKPEKVFKLIADNRESLLFTSNGALMLAPTYQYYSGVVMVFVNQETNKFTIVVQWPDDVVCMLAAGVDFEPYSGFQPWNHPGLKKDL